MFKNLCMSLDSLAEAINRSTIERKKQTELHKESLALQKKANDLASRTVETTEKAFGWAEDIMQMNTWSDDEDEE